MPYKLRKAPKRELYWVVGEDGKKHSKEPIPLERAKAQMRALYASMRRGGITPAQWDLISSSYNSRVSLQQIVEMAQSVIELLTPPQVAILRRYLPTVRLPDANRLNIYDLLVRIRDHYITEGPTMENEFRQRLISTLFENISRLLFEELPEEPARAPPVRELLRPGPPVIERPIERAPTPVRELPRASSPKASFGVQSRRAKGRRGGIKMSEYQELVATFNFISRHQDGNILYEDDLAFFTTLRDLLTPIQIEVLKTTKFENLRNIHISLYEALLKAIELLTSSTTEINRPELTRFNNSTHFQIYEALFPQARNTSKIEFQVGRTKKGEKYSIRHEDGKEPKRQGFGKCKKCGLVRLV
jgi:hypothetical protein